MLENKIIQQFLEITLKILKFFNFNIKNSILSKLIKILQSFKTQIIYIVEESEQEWAIYWIGKYITDNVKKYGNINIDIAKNYFQKHKIIHFGSVNLFFSQNKIYLPHKSNKCILTWFHVVPGDPRLKFVPLLNKYIDLLITPSKITKKNLVDLGLSQKKVKVLPLGADLNNFKKYPDSKREFLKRKLSLPLNKFIIGSFQKDGVGWGEGMEPKLVKGPDIFAEVVKALNKKFPIHVFLAGPARGYLKKKLEDYEVPFSYTNVSHLDIVDLYNVLDLYIISSRVEGGPLALTEAMATGVPMITTNVGMAEYLIKNNYNGFITEVEDIEDLIAKSSLVLENSELRNLFINNGLKFIKKYTWENIGKIYFQKVYKKFIK